MFDMNIMNEDIHYILKSTHQDNVSCFYSDYNDEGKIVFRIRPKYNIGKKKETNSFTQEDYVYYVKTFMEKILNDTVIRGVKDIRKVNLRKINGYKVYDDESNNYNKKDIYVLDTVGTNLYDILALDFIDRNKTFSNDIMEMYKVLGIEAARRCLFEEIMDVMEFDGAYVNHHHLHLLCDRMTCNEKMVSIFRHGINKDNIGPIAKASFEETTEMFLQAAKHGTLDNMRGVSANVMCGQEGLFGTSCFQVYIDSNKLFKQQQDMGYTSDDDDDERDIPYDIDLNKKSPETILKELSYVQNDTFGACSMENLKQISALDDDLNQIISVKQDDGYELDLSLIHI